MVTNCWFYFAGFSDSFFDWKFFDPIMDFVGYARNRNSTSWGYTKTKEVTCINGKCTTKTTDSRDG